MTTEGFQEYVDVHDAISQIYAANLDSTDLGAQAVERAEARLAELAGVKAVSDAIQEYYVGAHSQLSQLDQLENVALGAGLITQEELDTQRTKIVETSEYAAAKYFMKAVGSIAVGDATQEPSSTPVEAEAERALQDIQITIQGDGVQIGKQGKFVRLSGANSKEQTDYSVLRKTLLKTLIEKQGEFVSVDELWSEAFPGVEFNRDSMRQFKMWADGLTFRKCPIIEHNGKRGPSSAYGIIHFNVSLSEVTKATKQKPIEEVVPQSEPDDMIPEQRRQAVPSPDAPKPAEVVTIESAPEVHFPLGLTESYILAETLAYLDSICERYDIPVIEEKIVSELKKQTTTKDVLAVTAKREIEDVRGEIVEKVVGYFENEDLVLDDLGNMNEKDHRFGLFNYLIDIDWQERSMLILALAQGHTRLTVSLGGKRGLDLLAARLHAEGYPVEAEKRNGANLRVAIDEEADEDESDQTVRGDQTASKSEDIVPEEHEKAELETDTTEVPEGLPAQQEDEPVHPEAAPHSQAEGAVDWEQQFRQDVRAAIEALSSDNLLSAEQDPAETHRARVVSRMSTSSKMGTEEAIHRLRQAGLMKKDRRVNPADVEISAKELVCMHLFNANRDILSQKRKQRKALAIVETELAAFFE